MISINQDVKDSIAIWDGEAIIYHPLRGETFHLDKLGTVILEMLLLHNMTLSLLISKSFFKITGDYQTEKVENFALLVHSSVNSLISCEILIEC